MKKAGKIRKVVSALLISFLLTNIFFMVIISTNNVSAQIDENKLKAGFKFIFNPVIGFIFGLWDFNQFDGWGLQAGKVSAMISYFMVWLIVFVVFSDGISIVSPFSTWVAWIIGLGLTIILAQVKLIFGIARWIFVIVGAFGIVSIVLSLIAAFVLMIALSWGSMWARNAIMKIKMAKGIAKAAGGSKAAGEAIKNLAGMERQMEQAGKW